jgi:hypothetical protein
MGVPEIKWMDCNGKSYKNGYPHCRKPPFAYPRPRQIQQETLPQLYGWFIIGFTTANSCWMEIKISALTNEPWQIAASHFMISCINQSAVVSLLAQNRLVLDSKMPASKANLHAGQGMVRVICKGKNSKHTKTCIWKLLHFPRVYGCWTLHIYLSLLKEII